MNHAQSQIDLIRTRRDLESRYGPGLVYDVHDDDEMFLFMQEFWDWPHHVETMRCPADAMRTYLLSGDVMMTDLEMALRACDLELSEVDSFLEFASGYGRFTRFLSARLDPSRITVSDINQASVDYARKTFGVDGFHSAQDAGKLDRHGPFEVIFVASLFSHLTIDHWNAWLRWLYDSVAPGGVLIFSTHGNHARNVIFGPRARQQLVSLAPGFEFLDTNETHGRLPMDYYGSAFVTEDYVRGRIAAMGLGTVRAMYPAKLWGSQDLWTVEKPLIPAP